jgi:hypothetical protein
MEPLEQIAVLMTLMKRLGQVMDHERALVRSMKLETLGDLQDEKLALAEAYEIELARLRSAPERLATLDPGTREQLQDAMRRFQETASANFAALAAAQTVVERIVRNIADDLARSAGQARYGRPARGAAAAQGGQVISVAFDRKL